MTNHYKSRKVWREYATRKDFRHENSGLEPWKKYMKYFTNTKLRVSKKEIGNYGWYKKFHSRWFYD